MLGNFMYYNPTKLYFGEDSLKYLKEELKNYGKNVVLIYGGGSIKKIGLYDDVINILKECGKNIIEDGGVMSNPTSDKLREGAKIARDANADLLLAVGGGSVIDYAKGVSVSAYCDTDPWVKYYLNMENPSNKLIPVASILTMVGTGSEMNGGSVITDNASKLKIGHVFGAEVYPKFTILNPLYTYSVPQYQMVAGIFDIMSHIMEQYFSGFDDNTSDYLMEGLMRSLIHSSRIAVKNPKDYEARSNIMWISTWALNTLVGKGKSQDWEVHMIGQSMGGVTNATHGMTLSSVSIPYYKLIMDKGLKQFVKFAKNVWNVEKKSDKETALEGLKCLEEWMRELGVSLSCKELGANPDNFDDIVKGTFLLSDGYMTLTKEDVYKILEDSYKYE